MRGIPPQLLRKLGTLPCNFTGYLSEAEQDQGLDRQYLRFGCEWATEKKWCEHAY
jgi:hypothetical protein